MNLRIIIRSLIFNERHVLFKLYCINLFEDRFPAARFLLLLSSLTLLGIFIIFNFKLLVYYWVYFMRILYFEHHNFAFYTLPNTLARQIFTSFQVFSTSTLQYLCYKIKTLFLLICSTVHIIFTVYFSIYIVHYT